MEPEDAANDYGAASYPFHQSFHIADNALKAHDQNIAAVEKWWRPLATDPHIRRNCAPPL